MHVAATTLDPRERRREKDGHTPGRGEAAFPSGVLRSRKRAPSSLRMDLAGLFVAPEP